jgi:REP element-mobilizing transposase RayT
MAQSLGHSNMHIVFSTKHRAPSICTAVEEDLYGYIFGICKNLKCHLHIINGMPDHIHLLIEQHRTISLADLVGKVKANSSRWIKTHAHGRPDFSWQEGYGYFATGAPQFEAVKRYIQNQKHHHSENLSFQDEMRAAYRARSIDFDERYVWD